MYCYKTQINGYANSSKKNEKNEKEYNDFMSIPLKIKNKNNTREKEIIKIENGNKIISKKGIYEELAKNILEYKKYLSELNKMIPDFDIIFLMSILSYRLKERTIQNTWAFDNMYIYNYYKDKLQKYNKADSLHLISLKENQHDAVVKEYEDEWNYKYNEKKKKLIEIYFIEKPTIYEHSMVTYKNSPSYGNCMENTILQFLKILFWNYENDERYDLTKIPKIVNDVYKQELINIFNEIEKERTSEFDNDWVKFIMELQKEDKKYDLINKEYECELNATLNNLIIFLNYIIDEKEETDNTKFLDNLVKKINDKYSIVIEIKVNNNNIEEKIIINLGNKKKVMLLYPGIHAKFENAKISFDKNNILSKITDYESLSEYLKEESDLTLSEINQYICLDYIDIENKNDFYNWYLSNIEKNIIASTYSLFFLDDIIRKINLDIYVDILSNHIVNYLNYKSDDNTVWHKIATKYIDIDLSFWKYIINNELYHSWNIKNNLGETVWHLIYRKNNKIYNDFGNIIIEKKELHCLWKIKNNYGDTVWYNIVDNKNITEDFWNSIIKNNLYDSWNNVNRDGDTVWHYLVQNNNISKDFWNSIIKNNLYDSWNNVNINGDTVWHYLVQNNNISKEFWYAIISNKLYKSWNNKNNDNNMVWHYFFLDTNIPIEFWNEIIEKKLYKLWNEKNIFNIMVWHNLFKNNIIPLKFWNVIIENKLYRKWYKKNLNNNTVWFYIFINENTIPIEFWNIIIEKKLYKSWHIQNNEKKSTWHYVAQKENIPTYFWNELIKNNKNFDILWDSGKIFDKDNELNDVWFYLGENKIIPKEFWIYMINNKIYSQWHNISENFNFTHNFWKAIIETKSYTLWNEVDSNKKSVWYLIFINQSIPIELWCEIIKNKYYKLWKCQHQDIWGFIIENQFISENFWKIIADNKLFNTWHLIIDEYIKNTIWHIFAKKYINEVIPQEFWMNLVDNDDIIFNKWERKNEISVIPWHDIVLNNKIPQEFWEKIINRGTEKNFYIFNTIWLIQETTALKNTVWHNIAKNENIPPVFWMNLVDSETICDKWVIENNLKNMVWHNIASNQNIPPEFWNKIIEKKLYISWKNSNSFGRQVWHNIASNQNIPLGFWNKIIELKLYISWVKSDYYDNKVWHDITSNQNIPTKFWKEIISNNDIYKFLNRQLLNELYWNNKDISIIIKEKNLKNNKKYLKYKKKYLLLKNVIKNI